jgi:hypothetical protein
MDEMNNDWKESQKSEEEMSAADDGPPCIWDDEDSEGAGGDGL